jgi:hypothetical protein
MITETQIIANTFNDWFNDNGSKAYDIYADFNPLENERFDSSLERFNQTSDEMIKQQIASEEVRGVVSTPITPYDPVGGTYAVITPFTVNFWLDIKENATEVINDIYKLIFDENDGQYNGKVTQHIYGTTTYSIAWGFNKPTAFATKTIQGTKYQQVTMSGEATITAEDATLGIKGLYFGDNFVLSITGDTFAKTEIDGASSIEPTSNSRLKEQQLGGRIMPYIAFTENDITILYPFRKDDALALHFFDLLMGEIEAEDYELELKIVNGTTTVKTYIWSDVVYAGSRAPLQLSGLPVLTVPFKKRG